MKRKLLNLLLVALLLLAIPGSLLLASDISGALYKMSILVSNNGTLVNYVSTNTVVSTNSGWISTPNLIAGGFLNSSANNCAVLDAADNDIPFMPGYSTNPWMFWVETIGSDSYINYDLYTADTTGGSIAYFPDITGMIVNDNSTIEPGSDFEVEVEGWVDTTDSNFTYLDKKRGAYSNPIADTGEISGVIYFDEPEELIPSGFNAWTDVDVSEYVPAHATGIVVHLTNAAAAARDCGVRVNGSADDLKGDLQEHGWTIVGIDANNIFELFLQAADCHAYLVGFTGSDFTFKVAADDISLVPVLAWTDIDISTEAPGATGAVIVVLNKDAVAIRQWGLKKKGSADNRHQGIPLSSISWGIIGVNGSQLLEGYIETIDVDFYLVGYTTGNVNFFTNGIDKSIAALAAWTDIDCSGDVTGFTTHIIFEVIGTGPNDYGLQRNGSAENIVFNGDRHFWAVVECDENQVVEGYIEAVTTDWFIIGYIEGYVDNPYDVRATATGISSDEYTVTTYGVANEPAWATGDVLHFTGAADSNINAGLIHNASAKLWVSLWFKLDSAHAAGGGDAYLFGKYIDVNDYLTLRLTDGAGVLYAVMKTLTVHRWAIWTVATSWNADQWYHVILSISSVAGVRLIVDNGTPFTDADLNAVPNGGEFIIGDRLDPGGGTGFIGEIQNVIVGTGDLSTDEEDALYAGIAPTGANAPTEYWYIDEGTGTAIVNYGSAGAGSDGTADNACTWETATFTTGKTGRWCDFYIEVDDGVADPDRWGANLKGVSVPGNGNDWEFFLNDAMPYVYRDKITVGGVLHAWHEWEYDTTFHDRSYYGLDFDGVNDDITIAQISLDNTWTVEMWVYTIDEVSVRSSLCGDVQAFQGYIRLITDVNQVSFEPSSADALGCIVNYGAFGSVLDAWHLLTIVMDTPDLLVYIDGQYINTGTPAGAVTDLDVTRIGSGYAGLPDSYLEGRMDEVRIYTRALGLTEIEANYNGGLGIYIPDNSVSLVGEWHIETGSGVGAIIVDSSGEGNTGTLAGALWINGKVPRPAGSSGTNDAIPSFRTASSDVDVVATAVSFQPIEEAKAPPWTLDETAATWYTAANVVGNFTTTPTPTYPGADVIEDIAAATGTPAQLPFVIIFGFITLAISLSVSYVLRQHGSRSLLVKVILISGLLLIGETLGVIDLWMLLFYLFIGLAVMAASKSGSIT